MAKLFSHIDTVCKMAEDGNCQFRALSHGLHGTSEYHEDVRRCVVSEMNAHWERYKDFVDSPDTYRQRMSRQGTWGDNVTLQAFCNAYHHGVATIDVEGSVSLLSPQNARLDQRDYVTIVYKPRFGHYNAVNPHNVHPTRELLTRIGNRPSLNVQINRCL